MNKFQNDSQNLALQNAAYAAAGFESQALTLFLDGLITEARYMAAMEATEQACKAAVAAGVSRKDLPAH